MSHKKFITIKQAAELLQIHYNTAAKYIALMPQGVIRMPGLVRVDADEFISFMTGEKNEN